MAPDFTGVEIQPGHAYIDLVEDRVMLIKRIKGTARSVGNPVGVLSYNETPVKDVLLDGITVISTDFAHVGRLTAPLLLIDSIRPIKNPFRLIVRQSL